LQYRGIPIEQLAEKSTFLEVSYLLLFGELPTKSQLDKFSVKTMNHTYIHSDLENMIKSFRYDAHPMGMLVSGIAAMSTLHPEANPALMGDKIYKDPKFVNKQIFRILGNIPTLAASCYRHRIGRPFNQPRNDLSYIENFLYMMDYLNDKDYKPHPILTKALDVLFILHAEHELNCSTSAVRHLASSGVDVYSCISGGVAALYGPKHGGANEAVLRMLEQIGKKENIASYIADVKAKKKVLFGFGHRVYKSYDPRAKIVKNLADDVFAVLGKEPLIELAQELEKIALTDKYFIERNLYPNVDFYTGVIYKAMGFPTDMFVVLFSIPRMAGWLSHWLEFQNDSENKIVRPRQNYKGKMDENYKDISQRIEKPSELESTESSFYKRRKLIKKATF
jgi:citrate synthase